MTTKKTQDIRRLSICGPSGGMIGPQALYDSIESQKVPTDVRLRPSQRSNLVQNFWLPMNNMKNLGIYQVSSQIVINCQGSGIFKLPKNLQKHPKTISPFDSLRGFQALLIGNRLQDLRQVALSMQNTLHIQG